MSRFEQWEPIDLMAGPKKFTIKGGVFAKDAGSHRLGLIISSNHAPAMMTGTIQGVAKLPPHTGNSIEKYEFDGVIDPSDSSRVYIDVPAEALYYPGQLTIAIRNNTDDVRTVLATFTGWVDSTTEGTAGVPPSTLPDDIEDFIAELTVIRQSYTELSDQLDSLQDNEKAWFIGGQNGQFTENGVTVKNVGRKYTLNGTSTAAGSIKVSVLDGCVPWDQKNAVLHMKKGHTYRISLICTRWPAYQRASGAYERDWSMYTLWLMDATVNRYYGRARPGHASDNSDGTYVEYYCESNTDVQLMLEVMIGKDYLNGEEIRFKFSSDKLLVGFADVTGEETKSGILSDTANPPVNTQRFTDLQIKAGGGIIFEDDDLNFGLSDVRLIKNLVNYDGSINIGETKLTESKLQQLLALLE